MPVVEKIIELSGEHVSLLCFAKDHRPEIRKRLDEIGWQLIWYRKNCPGSWERAGRILSGKEALTCS